MKKKIQLLQITVIAMLLTGCLRYDYDVKIDNHHNADFQLEYGNKRGKEFTDFDREHYLLENRMQSYGYETEYIEDEKYMGMIYRKKINLAESCSENVTVSDLNYIFKGVPDKVIKCTNKGYTTVYEANILWEYCMPRILEDGTYECIKSDLGEEDEEFGMLYRDEELSFKLTLPVESISNNATRESSDGKTLEWDLADLGINEIKFSFELQNSVQTQINNKNAEKYEITPEVIYPNDEVKIKIISDQNKEIEKIIIRDSKNNIIDYRIIGGEYVFNAPNSNITIDIEYKIDNPSTKGINLRILFSIILSIGSILIILVKHSKGGLIYG